MHSVLYVLASMARDASIFPWKCYISTFAMCVCVQTTGSLCPLRVWMFAFLSMEKAYMYPLHGWSCKQLHPWTDGQG